ncbi:MAG: hypothetical protein HOL07_00900 [Rhodospirillaceae bacterium]|jgi:hypothetical protein|nr:hypothetical protein [Rhodospirillaceae bacterium]MBT6311359.1 hypothetical protein [Rhodospirillaceae bacterium]
MYKKAARFSQRATRSDFRLEDRLKGFEEKAEPKRKRRRKPKTKVASAPKKVAASEWAFADGTTRPDFNKTLVPLIVQLREQGIRDNRLIAKALNERNVKDAFGANWTRESASVLQDLVHEYLRGNQLSSDTKETY